MGGAEVGRGSHLLGECTKHSLWMKGPEWMEDMCSIDNLTILLRYGVCNMDGYNIIPLCCWTAGSTTAQSLSAASP